MEAIRCVYCHRREDRYFCYADPDMVHLHLVPDHGLAVNCLLHSCLLDEYEALYHGCEEESALE